jgi:hypothetical protein
MPVVLVLLGMHQALVATGVEHGYGANPAVDAKVRKSAAYLFARYSLPNG